MQNLRNNLLTYIGYVLDSRFSYEKVSLDFTKVGLAHEITTLRKEFSLLKKEGLITFRLRYRKPYPILSTKGKLEIKTRLAFKKFGPWDSKWRVVLFDLDQSDRKYRLQLVDALARLGFGNLHRGAYISAYPLLNLIDRLTNHLGIRQNVSLFTTEKFDEEKNMTKYWPIEKINKDYESFIKATQRIQRHARLWPLQAKILEQRFAEIFERDPHLPAEILPKDWQGTLAYNNFKDISNSY